MKTIKKAFIFVIIFGFITVLFLSGAQKANAQGKTNCAYVLSLLCSKELNPQQKSTNSVLISSSIYEEPKKEKKQKEKTIKYPSKSLIKPIEDSNSLNPEVIFELINNYRKSIGLSPFEKEPKLCQIAKERSTEINNEILVTGNLHNGLYSRNLNFWVTENLIYAENEQYAMNWWLNSPIHRQAITGNSRYSCGECNGNSCSQLFSSYTPKNTKI